MPHFEDLNAPQHITFHLADSLPSHVLAGLQEIEHLPDRVKSIERRKRLEEWIDAGYGDCILNEPLVAEMMEECLIHFHGQRYRLLEWVIMPNHVHVLIEPLPNWKVSTIVATWKKYSARKISAFRKIRGKLEAGDGATSPVWHREYWDRFIRSPEHLRKVIEYIRYNPVKAG